MQTGTLQELINFCESRKLGELATGLKQELKTLKKSGSTSLKGATGSKTRLSEKDKDKDKEQPDEKDT